MSAARLTATEVSTMTSTPIRALGAVSFAGPLGVDEFGGSTGSHGAVMHEKRKSGGAK